MAFVDQIRSISNEYVTQLRDIERSNGKRGRRAQHAPPTIHDLPTDYASWKPPATR